MARDISRAERPLRDTPRSISRSFLRRRTRSLARVHTTPCPQCGGEAANLGPDGFESVREGLADGARFIQRCRMDGFSQRDAVAFAEWSSSKPLPMPSGRYATEQWAATEAKCVRTKNRPWDGPWNHTRPARWDGVLTPGFLRSLN